MPGRTTILAKVAISDAPDDAIKYSVLSDKDELGNVFLEDYEWTLSSLPSKEMFEHGRFWIMTHILSIGVYLDFFTSQPRS